jgi:hypothetical protein
MEQEMARSNGTPLHTHDVPDEAPPFLQTWRRVYIAILIYLVIIIIAFYLFTRAYGFYTGVNQ